MVGTSAYRSFSHSRTVPVLLALQRSSAERRGLQTVPQNLNKTTSKPLPLAPQGVLSFGLPNRLLLLNDELVISSKPKANLPALSVEYPSALCSQYVSPFVVQQNFISTFINQIVSFTQLSSVVPT